MNNKLKIIVISIFILLLTGCSGNYNLTINKDMSVNEELELSFDNNKDLYNKTLKIFENNNVDKNKYDVNISNGKVAIKYNEKFNSIEDYILNSKVYKQLFNEIQYNKTKSYIDLYVSDELKLKNNYNLISGSNLQDLDMIQVNITNPYKMIYTNAEIENNNTYTWTIKKNDQNKEIQMQFKHLLNEFPYRLVIVLSVIALVVIISGINILLKTRKRQSI